MKPFYYNLRISQDYRLRDKESILMGLIKK